MNKIKNAQSHQILFSDRDNQSKLNCTALLVSFILLILTGCSQLPKELILSNKNELNQCVDIKNHMLVSDDRGSYVSLDFNELSDKNKTIDCKIILTALSSEDSAAKEKHITEILESLKKSKKKPFFFIHGGLNDYEDGIKRLYRDIVDINKHSDFYPIFLIWPSHIDTYSDSVANYFQGIWNNKFDRAFWHYKALTDVAQVPSRMLMNYIVSIRLFFNSQCYLEKGLDSSVNEFCETHTYLPGITQNFLPSSFIANDPCNGSNLNLKGVHCIHPAKEDAEKLIHTFEYLGLLKIITIPLADPISKRAWDSMLARIRFTFRTPCPLDGYSSGDCSPGIFYQFFEELNNRYKVKENDNALSQKITIFGHSMGAIVASEIIRHFDDLPYENVVFGGAAISIREFKNTVEATLKKKYALSRNYELLINEKTDILNQKKELKEKGLWSLNENTELENSIKKIENNISELKHEKERKEPFTFYNLSLHPYAEAREEQVYGSIPSGSLLEYIDQIIENPSTGLDLTLGKWANVAPLLPSPNNKYPFFDPTLFEAGYMHFSRFGLRACQPNMHPHFGNNNNMIYEYWKPENWKLDNKKIKSIFENCEEHDKYMKTVIR